MEQLWVESLWGPTNRKTGRRKLGPLELFSAYYQASKNFAAYLRHPWRA